VSIFFRDLWDAPWMGAAAAVAVGVGERKILWRSLPLTLSDEVTIPNGARTQFTQQDSYNFSGFPRLMPCMRSWRRIPERDLIPRGAIPTLTFINYPAANILEPMFRAIRNLTEGRAFSVIRNSATKGANITYRVVVNFEEPNGMFIENDPGTVANELKALRKREARYNHSFTMCPFSAEWVNDHLGRCHRTPMWQAVPTAFIRPFVPLAERQFDIVYMSAFTNNGPLREVLRGVFPKYNSRWFSARKAHGFAIPRKDIAQPLKVRLEATAQSRMALIVNALFFDNVTQVVADFLARPILASHAAFTQVRRIAAGEPPPLRDFVAVPQMKSRTFEAAMCGALMMVFDDRENIIERYFEPDTEFLYWRNVSHLEALMAHVVAHPAAYEPIARRAYEKTRRLYTTERWVEMLVQPIIDAAARP